MYQHKVNTDKTEYTPISKSEEGWKQVFFLKVRSLYIMTKTKKEENNLATVALYKLNNVWIEGNKLKTSKSLVKSILLYNCGTWALTLTEEERLNVYHRKQLKKIFNIRYLKEITNKSLYGICKEKPLSL